MGQGDNSYNCAYGLVAVHGDATPSRAVDATYRGLLRDGLAYTGARRRYTERQAVDRPPQPAIH